MGAINIFQGGGLVCGTSRVLTWMRGSAAGTDDHHPCGRAGRCCVGIGFHLASVSVCRSGSHVNGVKCFIPYLLMWEPCATSRPNAENMLVVLFSGRGALAWIFLVVGFPSQSNGMEAA